MAESARAYLEVGQKRVFAAAVDWPGWCRSGKSETAAMEALQEYHRRYEPVATLAGEVLGPARFEIVERVEGSATTDFGAPGSIPRLDHEGVDAAARARLLRLLNAAWSFFDDVVAKAPRELRKGPRGGGRDTEAIAAHVADAEIAYARKLGLDRDAAVSREALLRAVSEGGGGPWPVRYAVRRIAWHVLDHAWEIQDRSS